MLKVLGKKSLPCTTALSFCAYCTTALVMKRSRSPTELPMDNLKGPSRETCNIRLLTWNIDMDTPPISSRTRALIRCVRETNPDVIMLQEVTARKEESQKSSAFNIIRDALCTPPPSDAEKENDRVHYDLHIEKTWVEDLPYFILLLTRVDLFNEMPVTKTYSRFSNSKMGRGYICVQGTTKSGAHLALITSHLESLSMSSETRKGQFSIIRDMQRDFADGGTTSLFGGDTNLRESEVSAYDVCKTAAAEAKRQVVPRTEAARIKAARSEQRLGDAWVMAGCNPEQKFTWDTVNNDNLEMDTSFRPRARYDRVFVLGPRNAFPKVDSFRLLGTERLPFGKFISDHFGVLVDICVCVDSD